jgi:SNF2 family DNA or RNA helicase
VRDPGRIEAVIPKAKRFTHNGKEFLAVKHGVDEVKVLNNIGIPAPSPIKYHYDWPGQFKPFLAQRETADFLTLNNRAFVLNDIGTGKTLGTLWAFDYLRSIGVVKKALVVTPLSTLERVWADEVFNHFPHLTTSVLFGDSTKRLKMLNLDADLYLINHDGLQVKGVIEALKLREDIDLVIIDEIAQVARTAGTDRYKLLHTVVNKQVPRRAWGLTGTPTPNQPTDAWAQCRLLVPEKVPPYMSRFKESVMRQISNFIWVPRPDALKIVHEAMQPAIRYSRDECIDLPPCIYEVRQAELTVTQKKAYKDMLAKLKAEIAGGEVTAVNEAVKAQKLIQIACGVVYDNDHEGLDVDAGPRLALTAEICEEAATKVIVFVPFVSVIGLVANYLKSKGMTVEMIHGGVSKAERDRIIGAFQKSDNPRILVAQPACMSHGLTLTAASTIVWYAPITSADTFVQSNGRITRPSQKNTQLIIMIEGTDLERRYFKRLKDKEKTQGVLLDMVKDSR